MSWSRRLIIGGRCGGCEAGTGSDRGPGATSDRDGFLSGMTRAIRVAPGSPPWRGGEDCLAGLTNNPSCGSPPLARGGHFVTWHYTLWGPDSDSVSPSRRCSTSLRNRLRRAGGSSGGGCGTIGTSLDEYPHMERPRIASEGALALTDGKWSSSTRAVDGDSSSPIACRTRARVWRPRSVDGSRYVFHGFYATDIRLSTLPLHALLRDRFSPRYATDVRGMAVYGAPRSRSAGWLPAAISLVRATDATVAAWME